MDGKHTPGPWEVGGPYPAVSVIYCVEAPRADPDNPDPGHYEAICLLDSRADGEPNPQALIDARLIAAAPDMLAVLERFWDLACREGDFDSETDWAAVKAAVEKARGPSVHTKIEDALKRTVENAEREKARGVR